MAVNKAGGPGAAGGVGGVVRPLYGVFIRDQVAQLRSSLGVTLADLKAGIAKGDPNAQKVAGDGKLEGIEVKDAKLAANRLNHAINSLKPVFGGGSFSADTARANLRSGQPAGLPIAMYGVFLADDLRKYRTEISTNIQTIKDGIAAGTLSGKAKTEGQAALKQLNIALKDLGAITF